MDELPEFPREESTRFYEPWHTQEECEAYARECYEDRQMRRSSSFPSLSL